jgi:hypothetical protein
MFESLAQNHINNHSTGHARHNVREYARKHRHLPTHQLLIFRILWPIRKFRLAEVAHNLNGMQMNVKQNLHGIRWTSAEIGAKG